MSAVMSGVDGVGSLARGGPDVPEGARTFPAPGLPFAMALGALLGLVGWSLLATAGPGQEWVALLWLICAAGLVPMLTTLPDRRDTTTHRLGAAGLLATGASGLTVVLAAGFAGVLAIPFLPLLVAYTALLMTTGEEVPPQTGRHQIAAHG